MVRLEQAGNSRVHFLAPLPPGMNSDSPELFGFFTYELRVGHAHIWSTAQGRFGRALRVTGVQHPAPQLFCTVKRTEDDFTVEAPYALAVQNGKNITHYPPRTELWALLYAQVKQADGKDFRNILLDDRKLNLIPRALTKLAFENVDSPVHGFAVWTQAEIIDALRSLGLPRDAPLSVVCVEMMPTLAALRATPTKIGLYATNLAASVAADRSGYSSVAGSAPQDQEIRPLSEGLGHFRILRTSPLTPVPEVCCPSCA
jgi:hypothetical protein